jgi:hypothetical protein
MNPESDYSLSYAEDVEAFARYCRKHGFRGKLIASEWTFGAGYPPAAMPAWWSDFVCSEIQKAKYVAQVTVKHTGLGVGSFFCEQCHDTYPLDLSLMRRTFSSDPQSRQQPQAAYYVMRNLSNYLDSLEPDDFACDIVSAETDLEHYGLGDAGRRVVALWKRGHASDRCDGVEADICLDGEWQAEAFDCMNGTTCPLIAAYTGGRTRIPGLLVRDYPLLVELTARSEPTPA